MSPSPSPLRTIARAYVRDVRSMSYRELRARQEPPYASIGCGALGIALSLSRASRTPRGGHSGDREHAQRWHAAAARGHTDDAFHSEIFSPEEVRHSLYYGPDGPSFVRALLTHASDPPPAREDSLRPLLARCREARSGPTELVSGSAGHLNALAILLRRAPSPRALSVADGLARTLLEHARAPKGWTRAPALGFAHGRAGTFYALLAWSHATGRELPSWLFDALDDLATGLETADAASLSASAPAYVRTSWCNGAAGFALLWARTFELTSNPVHLRRARKASRSLLKSTTGAPGDLCCGLAGRAYALLAMDRISPDRGWYERAVAMADSAALAMLAQPGPWPNGLFKGFPGLVALAGDLSRTRGKRSGFPAVEG